MKSPTKNDPFKPLQEDNKSPRRNRRNQQRGSPEVSDSKVFPISINLPIVGNLAEQPLIIPRNKPIKRAPVDERQLHHDSTENDDIDYFHTSGNVNLLGATYLKQI